MRGGAQLPRFLSLSLSPQGGDRDNELPFRRRKTPTRNRPPISPVYPANKRPKKGLVMAQWCASASGSRSALFGGAGGALFFYGRQVKVKILAHLLGGENAIYPGALWYYFFSQW